MRKIFLLVCLGISVMLNAGNLVRNGDFNDMTPKNRELKSNGGKLSIHTEDETWNKCGKLEIDKISTDKDGREQVACAVWVGSDGDKIGFPVKPNTTYRFSLEIRGTASSASLGALQWNSDDLRKDRPLLKTTVGNFKVPAEWAVFKGTFKTGDNAKRAALNLQLWWNTRYGPQKYKVGDYILFDNIVIEEDTRKLGTAETAVEKAPKVTKAALIARTDSSPVIDGKLNDKSWNNAPEITDFILLDSNKSASTETVVKLLADENYLFIGVTCREPERIVHAVSDNGKKIWLDDVVEIFFGPLDGDRLFSQFAVSAGGGRYAGAGDKEINNYDRWQAAVSIENNVWHAEIRIPFTELGQRKISEGDSIAFNITRQRKAAKELICWPELKDDFHEVSLWGRLVFYDYAAGLKKQYGLNLEKVDRNIYETQAAIAETALLNSKYSKLGNRKLAVAPVSVTADFSIPFVPDEIFAAKEKITLRAAINEIKPLPLAIANLSDKPTEYRVELETADSTSGGDWGLKNFPASNITIRQGVRVKEADNSSPGEIIDPLPVMNEAFTIMIPPRECGLVWIDFDTASVAAGFYHGRLRVMPLNQPAQLNYRTSEYSGDMLELSVSLEVLNIVLPTEPASPGNFFRSAHSESLFKGALEAGARVFQISPWSFYFELDNQGRFIDTVKQPGLRHLSHQITTIRQMADKYGVRIQFFIGFDAYPVFTKLYKLEKDQEKGLALWPGWLAALDRFMKKHGLTDRDYFVEVFDEPPPDSGDLVFQVCRAVGNTIPEVRLSCTFSAHLMPLADIEKFAPYLKEFCFWSRAYFNKPDYIDFMRRMQQKGKRITHYTCDVSLRSSLARNYRRNAWFGEYYRLDGNALFCFVNERGGLGVADWQVVPYGNIAYSKYGNFLPSLRYMALRQGVTDIKYLATLREKGGNIPEVREFLKNAAQKVVIDYEHDPDMPDKVREEAANLILKYQK